MSNATTLRISARQLADAAYRALRVAGVPSGVAADAARDAVELERRRGRGLEVLERILNSARPLPLMHFEADGAATRLDACGASALLHAVPLVALACEGAPSPLVIHELAHCGALEPALARRARAEHRRFVLNAGDGTPVLCVEPAHSVLDAGWSAAWDAPLDVRLTVQEGEAPRSATPVACSTARPLMVAAQRWERLSERATPYLVSSIRL
jgi:hypothetical protein